MTIEFHVLSRSTSIPGNFRKISGKTMVDEGGVGIEFQSGRRRWWYHHDGGGPASGGGKDEGPRVICG